MVTDLKGLQAPIGGASTYPLDVLAFVRYTRFEVFCFQ